MYVKRLTTKVHWLGLLAGLLISAGGCGSGDDTPVADLAAVEALRGASGSGASSGDPSAASTGTGWGTLKGRIVITGSPPATSPLNTGGKDSQVCGVDSKDTSFITGDGGGVANVIIYARKVSRVHESFAELIKEPAVFDQKECVFLERVKPVFVGQPVLIKNSDPVGHNTSGNPPGDDSFNSLVGPSGIEVRFKKPQSEPFPVTCSIHAWMKAFMIPRKDPYVARTAADGTFEIANLPAGETIEFQIWHERAVGPKNGLVAGKSDPNGRLKLKVPGDGETVDLGTIEVTSANFK